MTHQVVVYGRFKTKEISNFSSESSRGRSREVLNAVISLGNFWYFGNLVAGGSTGIVSAVLTNTNAKCQTSSKRVNTIM